MQRTLWRLLPAAFALGVVGGVWPGPGPAAGQSLAQRTERIILSLGNDQFIPKAAIEATTDARFQSDLRGLRFLDEVSVIVLADLPYDRLPAPLQANLAAWVELGGSLLVTGGNNSFGLGGYGETPLGEISPLRPIKGDKTGHSFSPVFVLSEGHPLFAGVTTAPMAFFNETTLVGDGRLLLEYRGAGKAGFTGAGMTGSGRTFVTTVNPATGQPQVTLGTPAQSQAGVVTNPVTGQTIQAGPGSGTASSGAGATGQAGVFPGTISSGGSFNPGFGTEGGIQGGGRAAMPLVAERRQGKGLVVAVALDMNATGEWRDGGSFAANLIRYGLDLSKLPAP